MLLERGAGTSHHQERLVIARLAHLHNLEAVRQRRGPFNAVRRLVAGVRFIASN